MSELRRDSLSFVEALGQSVANVSPTFTPALAVAVVAGTAATASWLVYLIATVALIIVGLNISKLAAKNPTAGSFFIYISRSMGTPMGMLAGWAMLLAYIFTALALMMVTSVFVKALAGAFGITTLPPNWVIYGVLIACTFFLAYRDIRMSSRMGLALEGISMVLILAVCIATWGKLGFKFDPKQVHLEGTDPKSMIQAVIFAIFSYVGFESASTLGRETKNPHIAIPRAVILTPIIAGLFFTFTTFVIVYGFGDDATKLGASATPLSDLTKSVMPWASIPVYIGAGISAFACSLASLNAFSRMMFSLGRYQFVHRSMGFVHDGHKTPHFALGLGAVMVFVIAAICSKFDEVAMCSNYGTIATFGFVFVYLLCSIAAPLQARSEGTAKAGDYVLGGLGALLMLAALAGSVYPVPAYPANLWPYVFIAYMLVGAAWFLVLKMRAPQALLAIQHDLEGLEIPHGSKIEG
jgi:amino acid transporter